MAARISLLEKTCIIIVCIIWTAWLGLVSLIRGMFKNRWSTFEVAVFVMLIFHFKLSLSDWVLYVVCVGLIFVNATFDVFLRLGRPWR